MSKIKKGWIDIGSGATQLNADSIPAGSTHEIPLINHGHSEITSTLLAKVSCDTSESGDFESGVVFCENNENENDAGFFYRGRTLYLGSGAIDITPELVSNGASAFDSENDIELMKSAKNKVAGWDNRISESQQKRLDELGIIKNGFISHKKLTTLQLGAFEQLWNVIRKVANKLGIGDEQLMEYAKDYQ